MPNQSHQNTLHLLNCHVHMLNHSSIQHARRIVPPPTFLLQVIEALQNDTFPMGETVSDVGKIVTRVTGKHTMVLFRRVSGIQWLTCCGGILRSSPKSSLVEGKDMPTTSCPHARARLTMWVEAFLLHHV